MTSTHGDVTLRVRTRDGADVVIVYKRNRPAAEATADAIVARGRRVLLIQADVRDPR